MSDAEIIREIGNRGYEVREDAGQHQAFLPGIVRGAYSTMFRATLAEVLQDVRKIQEPSEKPNK